MPPGGGGGGSRSELGCPPRRARAPWTVGRGLERGSGIVQDAAKEDILCNKDSENVSTVSSFDQGQSKLNNNVRVSKMLLRRELRMP